MKYIRNHTKLIYYRPGLISLILLPVLCIWYLKKNETKNITLDEIACIESCCWDKGYGNYDKELLLRQKFNKKYTHFELTGEDAVDLKNLEIAQIKIKELFASTDTSNGVHFYFQDNSKYWSLIKVLDILIVEKAKTYINYKNDIWIINYIPPKE